MTSRRRRWLAAAVVGLALAWAGAAQAGLLSGLRDRKAAEEAGLDGSASSLAKGEVSLPPGSRSEIDVAFGDDPLQTFDVFIPAEARNAPILLMVHGGAWMLGDKGNRGVAVNKVARWLPRGYIVVSTNYRISRSQPNPLTQADDVAMALALVQKKAAGWGGDASRVVLMGHSSGAHLVSLLSADPRIAQRHGAAPWLGTVALDSAAFDLVEIMQARHFGFYDRVFGKDRNTWTENSPYHRLTGVPKPMLLVCSSRRSDSCAQARRFADKATAAGARVTVMPVDLAHGGINIELGKPGDYTTRVEEFLRSLGLP